MTPNMMAQRAYSARISPVQSPWRTEYDLFAQVTHRLTQAARLGKSGFAALAEAIHDNRELWTTLAVDVADSDNGLPEDLRAQIFYLAEFTQVHSRLVLKKQASVVPLIEINAAIMRGLRSGKKQ